MYNEFDLNEYYLEKSDLINQRCIFLLHQLLLYFYVDLFLGNNHFNVPKRIPKPLILVFDFHKAGRDNAPCVRAVSLFVNI